MIKRVELVHSYSDIRKGSDDSSKSFDSIGSGGRGVEDEGPPYMRQP